MNLDPVRRASRRSRVVERAAVRFYRVLLVWYPRAFRVAHGAEAAALFGQACRDNWSQGSLGRLGRRVLSALATVPREGWAERRVRGRGGQPNDVGPVSILGGPGSWTDLKYACRSISRRPALSATIVGTLAVGMGTNTAVFSVIDATVLRPLPYVDARHAMVLEAVQASGGAEDPNPKATWVDTWAAQASRVIERVEARTSRLAVLTGSGAATRRRLMAVTAGYLPSIGARPFLGRLLTPADSRPGAPPVTVITRELWRSQFGQRPDILGATIAIDGIVHQIVGVASAIESDIPGLTFSLAVALPGGSREPVRAVAWLRQGVSPEAAQGEVGALAPVVEQGTDVRARLVRPDTSLWDITIVKATELGMTAAALLLLVIAGVNVVNLLLAAGEARLPELAVRRALGASPRRLIRLLLLETAVLTLSGAAIGLGLAWAIVRSLTALGAGVQLQTQLERIRLDPVVIGYTVGIAVLMTIAVGALPALRGARTPSAALKESGTRSVIRLRRAASVLVAVETGLSAVLLVAAGVVGRSFLAMQFAQRGFDSDHVMSVNLELPSDRYATPTSRAAFFNALLEDVSRLPGVDRAGIGYGATTPPNFVLIGKWSVAGSTTGSAALTSAVSFVTPGYFALMGIPFLQGADFTTADLAAANASLQPAIVSRSLARRFWGDANAIGAIVEVATPPRVRRYRVIGVSGDVSMWGLMLRHCRNCDPQLYAPLPDTRHSTDVLVHVRPGAPFPVAELRAAIARLDPDVPSDDDLQTAEESLSDFIQLPRFTSALFAAFGGLAILLVAVGLSAVVAHAVAQRTREMGIRMALGATRGGVRRLVIAQGLRPAFVGLVIGLGAALVVTRYLRAVLYGMSPTDPITFVGAPLILMAIALTALSVPALRATRVDPVQALRAD
jgi:putative ABC transport system permease protein